jgi:hypothetical protein
VRERNLGEYDHGRLQARLAIRFGKNERDWRIRVVPIEQVFTGRRSSTSKCSRDGSLRSIRQRVDDYLTFGVPDVWILTPVLRKAYACTPTGFREPDGGILEASGTSIRLPLAEVFAELDS